MHVYTVEDVDSVNHYDHSDILYGNIVFVAALTAVYRAAHSSSTFTSSFSFLIRAARLTTGRRFGHNDIHLILYIHCESKKLGHFYFYCNFGKCWSIFKFFQCRNQKEMAHNRNKKFSTVA